MRSTLKKTLPFASVVLILCSLVSLAEEPANVNTLLNGEFKWIVGALAVAPAERSVSCRQRSLVAIPHAKTVTARTRWGARLLVIVASSSHLRHINGVSPTKNRF